MNEKKRLKMVEDLQCPCCVCGSSPKCGSFELEYFGTTGGFRCKEHVPSGNILGANFKMLHGFPKGFNRVQDRKHIWLFFSLEDVSDWGAPFDFPVWKGTEDGRAFLRVVSPRIGRLLTFAFDSIEGYDKIDCIDVTDLDMD